MDGDDTQHSQAAVPKLHTLWPCRMYSMWEKFTSVTYCDVSVIYVVALGKKVISELGVNCNNQVVCDLGFDDHLQ